MSAKNDTEVVIDGKIYTLSGYESKEYLQKVAEYINSKVAEFKHEDSYRRQSADVRRTILELNIADDYFKAKKQADNLESDIEQKDKQLYDIKHELIASQIKTEALEKEVNSLRLQLNEKEKELIKSETELADAKTYSTRRKKVTTEE